MNVDYDKYREGFRILQTCTKISKFRDFQYRLLLNKLVCNVHLWEWGKKENGLCTFCKVEVETTRHILFKCELIQPLLKFVTDLANENDITIEINETNFIVNSVHSNATHVINFVCLMLKLFIYCHRCKGKIPRKEKFVTELILQHDIEFANAKRSRLVYKHRKRWSPIIIFEDE